MPDGSGFQLLAEPSVGPDRSQFGLYALDRDSVIEETEEVEVVSGELRELLLSALDYPPAIALAQKQVGLERTRTKEQFVVSMTRLLRLHLAEKASCHYLLVESLRDEIGYKDAGRFYWIVGYNRDRRLVAWVSRDFQIYNDELSEFDVSEETLLATFGGS